MRIGVFELLVVMLPWTAAAQAPEAAPASAPASDLAPASDPAPVSAAAPVSDAAPIAAPAPTRGLTVRKCTTWSAGLPTTKQDFVFRKEQLVQRSVEELEVTYQLWDVEDTLEPEPAQAACRAKARDFCLKNGAAKGMCRYEVHDGVQNAGWDGAAVVPPEEPKPKRAARKTRKKAG